MDDYKFIVRSNYFGVKDLDKFKELCRAHQLKVFEKKSQQGIIYAFGSYDLRNVRVKNHDDGSYTGRKIINLPFNLSNHLVHGHVAIIKIIGYEKLKNVFGYALALDSVGHIAQVDLDSIYDLTMVSDLGKFMTLCEY